MKVEPKKWRKMKILENPYDGRSGNNSA